MIESDKRDGPAEQLDQVLEKIPLGRFHYVLLLMCGLSFMADGMEVSLLSFIATCAGNEWDLSYSEISMIISAVFGGQLVGSYFWGPVADKYGRRLAFVYAAVLITVAGVLSGAATDFWSLIIFRALVGFGLGGASVPFDLLAEFSPPSHRGQYLMYIEYFWTIGSMFVAGMAWIFLTSSGWRILTYVTAIPVALSSVASIWYLPESPRWLLVQGRIDDAEKVIHLVAKRNQTPMQPFMLAPLQQEESHTSCSTFCTFDTLKLVIPLWTVWFCFGFTYYGVILFTSRIFEEKSNDDDDDSCSFDYQAIFLSACAEVIGCTITVYTIDNWGRVSSQSVMYFLCAAGALMMGILIQHKQIVLIFSIIARVGAMSASSATWVHTPELFSTELRATAHCVANSVAQIGSFFTPFVVNGVGILPVAILLCAFNALAAVCTFLLPETAGRDLDKKVRPPSIDEAIRRLSATSASISRQALLHDHTVQPLLGQDDNDV